MKQIYDLKTLRIDFGFFLHITQKSCVVTHDKQ